MPMARWIVCLLLLASPVQAQRVNPQKLRDAVCLPRPPFNFSHGAHLRSEDHQPSRAEVEKRFRGDEGDAEHFIALAGLYDREKEKDKISAELGKAHALL